MKTAALTQIAERGMYARPTGHRSYIGLVPDISAEPAADEEAFLEDESEVLLWADDRPPDYRSLPPGHLAVRPGFEGRCPAEGELRRLASPKSGSRVWR